MSCIIDIQGFKGPGQTFILKEIAVITEENMLQHFILKPPYIFNNLPPELKKQALWLHQYHHGFSWDDGYTSMEDITKICVHIFQNKIIYVKGDQKIKWLNQLFRLNMNNTIYNLEDFGCPRMEHLRKIFIDVPRCILHSGKCAKQNVFLCKRFMDGYNKILC